MSHNRLLDSLTQLKIQGIVTQEYSPSPTLPTAQSTNEFTAILSNFADVTKPHYGNHPIKHDITHHITTTGPPVTSGLHCTVHHRYQIHQRIKQSSG